MTFIWLNWQILNEDTIYDSKPNFTFILKIIHNPCLDHNLKWMNDYLNVDYECKMTHGPMDEE